MTVSPSKSHQINRDSPLRMESIRFFLRYAPESLWRRIPSLKPCVLLGKRM